jgi:hypothetical protein
LVRELELQNYFPIAPPFSYLIDCESLTTASTTSSNTPTPQPIQPGDLLPSRPHSPGGSRAASSPGAAGYSNSEIALSLAQRLEGNITGAILSGIVGCVLGQLAGRRGSGDDKKNQKSESIRASDISADDQGVNIMRALIGLD